MTVLAFQQRRLIRASEIGDPRLPARFWSKINPTGCWEWTGAHNEDGYAHFFWDGRTRGAHRVAYAVLVGPIPEGLELDHLCRVRHCVNPAHLEPVEHLVNVQRAINPRRDQKECNQGHLFSTENTYIDRRGWRQCRTCRRATEARYRERRKTRARGVPA